MSAQSAFPFAVLAVGLGAALYQVRDVDIDAAQGDRLVFGGTATRSQFQVNTTETTGAGAAGVDEAFVIYRPTGQILWALVDGGAQGAVNIQIGGQVFDLLA